MLFCIMEMFILCRDLTDTWAKIKSLICACNCKIELRPRCCAGVQGRKMSKSLGNVIDPIDVLSEFGTDALRYTMATGTTPGQDLNLSMTRVTSSRNLTNKLWNATKYVLFGLQEVSDQEFAAFAHTDFSSDVALQQLPLSERWIVSRLHSCAAPIYWFLSAKELHLFEKLW